jgi:hypothetical protein
MSEHARKLAVLVAMLSVLTVLRGVQRLAACIPRVLRLVHARDGAA